MSPAATARTAARTTARPRTGEVRKTNQPLKIDRLPPAVQDAIADLYGMQGKSWTQIESLSAEPVGRGHGGFVDWDALTPDVQALFPLRHLPHTNMHRWYDLRRVQIQKRVMESAEQARIIAKVFANAAVTNDENAILNAARDLVFTNLSESSTGKERQRAIADLTKLAVVKQVSRANDLKARKVSVDEQTLQIKLDEIKRRTQELLDKIGKGDGPGVPLTKEELLGKLGELYGVA